MSNPVRLSRPASALVDSGEVASANTLASVTHSRVDGGPGDGMRVIDIQMAGGFTARILPDRGLDISTAWSHGVPIGWMSKVGEVAPLARADGMAWIERFTGGLLTTCGPDNIGVPSVDGDESLGLHGSWTFLRATDVHVSRERVDGELMVDITGTLRQTHALGRNIEIKRLVRLLSGQSVIAVMDEITNLGSSAEPMPMLYHVNIGAPLWSAGATIEYPPETTLIPRNSNAAANVAVASVGPEPIPNGEEYVFERVVSGDDTVPVIVRNPALGLKLSLTWSRSSLPRFHQWIHPASGVYALGIEPANAALGGRAAEREAGTLPMLESGESRRFGFSVMVEML